MVEKTLSSHRRVTRRFDAFLADRGESMDACSSTAIDDFTTHLLDQEGMASPSVRIYVGLAHLYVDWCASRGAALPVMARARLPRAKYKMPSFLREHELDEWLRVIFEVDANNKPRAPEPYASALGLLPALGLRVKEHCAMRLTDLQFVKNGGDTLVKARVEGKSKRERLVPMLSFGYPILGRYLRDVRPTLLGHEWLFPGQRGNPLRPERMEEHARRLRTQLGRDDLTPHTMRHTYATILAANGMKPFEIALVMGHEDVKTTTIYVHPESDRIARQVRAIDYHDDGRAQ